MTERIDIVVQERGADRVKRSLNQVGDVGDRTARAVQGLQRALLGLGIGFALERAISVAKEFGGAIAEISTLVDTATFDMESLTQAALDNARAFGQSPVAQAQAFYQIISAGASTAAQAQDILTASNRLATAGVTEVAVAADVLTSVLNSYGDGVRDATAVSDALFIGVRAGKTTVDELAASLGKVAPLASTAGVSFDELVAATAALTKGGISTREAVTGVRGILAAVVKPTSEAEAAAAALGIEFNAAALESQGLAQFLENLIVATDGNTATLAQFFGGVEALVPILALTGAAGEDFEEILLQLGDAAGTTDEAFLKITQTFGFQLNRVIQGAQAQIIALTTNLNNSLTPVLKVVADNIEGFVLAVQIAAVALGTTFAARAVPLAIASLRALTVAALANPFTAIVIGVTAAITAIVAFGEQIRFTADGSVTVLDVLKVAFQAFGQALSTVFNFIGGLLGGFQNSVDGFSVEAFVVNFGRGLDVIASTFVGVFSAIETFVLNTLNRIGAAISDVLNQAVEGFDDFRTGLNVIGRRLTGQELDASVLFRSGVEFEPRFAAQGTSAADAFAAAYEARLSEGTFTTGAQNFVDNIASQFQSESIQLPELPSLPTIPSDPQEISVIQNQLAELNAQLAETPSLSETIVGDLGQAQVAISDFVSTSGGLLGEFFETTKKGFGDSIGRAVFDVDNLGESLKSVARNAISQFVSSLVQIGVQQAANFAIGQTLQAAATTSTVAQQATIAAAAAPAAAAVSLATAGTNSVGANIGITTVFALLAGLVGGAALAGFRDGTDFVGGPGTSRSDSIFARLSRGEAVINAAGNSANPGVAAAMNRGERVGGVGTVVFNFPNANPETFRRSRRQLERETRLALERAT